MKRFLTTRAILLSILVLAAFLRLWRLDNVPPSASMDEASIGYNAYSVLKIGVDEYGSFPLISQRGYDDWRRSTYLFLVVPFIALFDLNVIAIRLPAVILSIFTVWASYHVVLSLFSTHSERSSHSALLASFLLAISPWHIYISRLGHESNAYLSFFVFGVLFFLQGIKKKNRILLSVIFFTLSMISYYAGQVFLPLFALGLLFIYRKNLITMVSSNKKIIILIFIIVLILTPIFWTIFSPNALVRFQGTSTFKPEAHWQEFAERTLLRNKAVASHDLVGQILYNQRLFPVKVFIDGYISHFNPKWLFTNSSAEPFKVPNMGLLYLWEIPFIIVGIMEFILSPDLDQRVKKVISLWLILAPFPAAVATQAPHAMRSYAFLPTWQIFTAFGLIYALGKLQRFKLLGLITFAFLILISLKTFYKNYYIIFPKEQSQSFHYALSRAIPYVLANEKYYKKIVFSNSDNLFQSYMLFLYYSRYDPVLYQREGGTKSGGFAEIHQFGKFEFRPINRNGEHLTTGTLFVGNSNDFPASAPVTKTFKSLDGQVTIKMVSI